MLAELNEHERDKNITFYEDGHIYNVKGMTNFTSVTTWVKKNLRNSTQTKLLIL